jgi:hypothetical protein
VGDGAAEHLEGRGNECVDVWMWMREKERERERKRERETPRWKARRLFVWWFMVKLSFSGWRFAVFLRILTGRFDACTYSC